MNYLDLFSGIGGFHLGLERAGFNFDWSGHSEIDKNAKSIYEKHFPESEDLGNVRAIRASKLPRGKYIVTGGWPCQDNSIAGKRAGQAGNTRSGLFNEIIRIISELIGMGAEVIFIGENVKGLYSVNYGFDFIKTVTRLTDLDTGLPQLSIQSQLLNTRWFLPQNRERIYFVGHARGRGRSQVFPIGEGGQENRSKDKIRKVHGIFKETERLSDAFRIRDASGDSVTLKGLGGGMGAKTGLYEVKRAVLKYPGRNQKNIEGDYSFTVDAVNTGGIQLGSNVRRLTPVECARLQGFPDNWCLGLSDTQQYKCFGNAVSVPVVEAIARKLL